jgi:hypothetical protein
VTSEVFSDLSLVRFETIPAPTGNKELITDENGELGENAYIPTKINISNRRSIVIV